VTDLKGVSSELVIPLSDGPDSCNKEEVYSCLSFLCNFRKLDLWICELFLRLLFSKSYRGKVGGYRFVFVFEFGEF